MNNEEKILSLLEALTKDVAELKQSQIKLEGDVNSLKEGQVKTNVILENEIRPNISLLAEGHKGVIERLDKLDSMADELEDVKDSVSILKLLHIKKD